MGGFRHSVTSQHRIRPASALLHNQVTSIGYIVGKMLIMSSKSEPNSFTLEQVWEFQNQSLTLTLHFFFAIFGVLHNLDYDSRDKNSFF